MYVDNRFLIPIVAPFFLLLMARLMWFASSAPWEDDGFGAGMCLFFGLVLGFLLSVACFLEGVSLGGFYIGKRPDEPDDT